MSNIFNSFGSISTLTNTTVFPVVDPSTGQTKKATGQNFKDFLGQVVPATTSTLGGIKVGRNLQVTIDGTLSSINAKVSPTPPLNPTEGDLWWDENTGKQFIFYDGFWVESTTSSSGSGGTINIGTDLAAVNQHIIPSVDNTYDLGSPTRQWRDIFVSNGSIYIGDVKLSNTNGTLQVQQVTDAGLVTEAPVPNTPGIVTTDRLVNGNLSLTLNNLGTLNTPSLLPRSFTATVDAAHYAGEGSLTLEGDAWYFAVEFRVNADGSVETIITNNTPWSNNPGYINDMPFEFTEADHGIPGYTFGLILTDIQNPGPFMWTTNLTATQPPVLPATISNLETIKLTADATSWTFSPDGKLKLPAGGDIVDSNNVSVLGGGGADLGLLKISGSTIGTKDDPDTGNWGSYGLYLDPGGESYGYIQIPSVPGQTAGGQLVIANNNVGNGGIRLSVNGGNYLFVDTGLEIPYNTHIKQNNSWTRVTTPTVNFDQLGTVVWTSTVDYISSAKLIIQVECSEAQDESGWHSQVCEAIIACRGFAGSGPTGDPQMVVYGVVHTSINPLVTFTVRRNPNTLMVEVVGTLTATAAGAADLRIHSVEMSTRD